jgi:hypothetical protein
MPTNLPPKTVEDSSAATRVFFETYGSPVLEFPATDVDASIAFFEGKGFDRNSAIVVSVTLLRQAKVDGVPIWNLLEKIKSFTGIQLNSLITEILNNNRPSTSSLGFRAEAITTNFATRNIAA